MLSWKFNNLYVQIYRRCFQIRLPTTNLHFNLRNFNIFEKEEERIIFLGFQIKRFKSSQLNYLFLSKKKSYKKYFFRIVNKIELNLEH